MNQDLLVSIVIPVFNGSNYLSKAIESALIQDYSSLEIIVINDGSNDNSKTRDIALSFGEKIRYFEKENGGVASALNFGISKMQGDYFSWLSHDDLYVPNKISSQVNFLKQYDTLSKKNIVFSDYELIDFNEKVFGRSNLAIQNISSFRIWLTGQSLLNGCTLLIPRAAFDGDVKFNEDLKHTQDYDFWFRIAEKFDFVYFHQHLVKSRQHPEQDSIKLAGEAWKEVKQMKLFFVKSLGKKDFKLIHGDFSLIQFFVDLVNQGFYLVAFLFVVKYLKYRSLKSLFLP
jgi:glycosyltransferase involved in cell wall biosynthesis